MSKKIMLDAGHGAGLRGNKTPDGIDEWALNNKVANYVADYLKDYDVTIMRSDDTTGKTDVALSERVKKANAAMPDAFVSIHHNAYQGKWGTHSGVEVYYNGNRGKDSEKKLAQLLAANLSKETGLQNRGAKSTAFYVLTASPNILLVLTEGGFMDSSIDHKVITSTAGQKAYAKAVADSLIRASSINLSPR